MSVKRKIIFDSDDVENGSFNHRSPEPVISSDEEVFPNKVEIEDKYDRLLLFRIFSNKVVYCRKGKPSMNQEERNYCDKRNFVCRTSNAENHQLEITMMDPDTKQKQTGEPLDPVPPHRWATNVICGEGENLKMAHVTGPNKDYLFASGSPSTSTTNSSTIYDEGSSSIPSVPSVVPSPDENAPVSNSDGVEKSPPRKKSKFSKNTTAKSSSGRSRNTDSKNDSHVGEQTPHTSGKNATVNRLPSIEECVNNVCMRVDAAFSPQPIRVRDIPLPNISWSDSTELSLLMCFKEDIGLTERSSTVFRRHPNLNTRMRAILFDWLMEVCDVYKLRRVTYYLAIDYIDRFLSRTDIIPKNHLQLLGITCLFIAAKVEEIYPPKLAELAYVTDGACTDADMLAKEMDILTELHWDVNPMTVTGWLCLYLQLASVKGDKIRDVAHRLNTKDDDVIYPQFSPHLFMTASMLLDLCSLDDGMLQFKYSVIAASVVYFVVNREKALFVSGYTWDNIKLCVEWMIPFAEIVFRVINMRPLLAPREYIRSGSALRVVNPSIVLDEGHTLQNHVIDLKMLEDVYANINLMRQKYRKGIIVEATGWSASDDGYDPSCVAKNPPKRKTRRKHLRTSTYAQAISRGDSRVYLNSNQDPAVGNSSESDNDQRKRLNKSNEPVPSVSGITPLKNKDQNDHLPRSSSFEEASSPLSTVSVEFGHDPHPDPPAIRIRYVDDDGNHIDRTLTAEEANDPCVGTSKQLNPAAERGKQPDDTSQKQRDSDVLSDNGSEKSQGSKRPRYVEPEYIWPDEDEDDEEPPRKKSCCHYKKTCGSMLASPKCSGLYLKPGQSANFRLRRTRPENAVLPPEPREPPLIITGKLKNERADAGGSDT